MITINNEQKLYTPVFLGTTQHSLGITAKPSIMIGMMFNDEIVATYHTRVSGIDLGLLPNIGDRLPVTQLNGNELVGFYAELKQSNTTYTVDDINKNFEQLLEIKNVGQYRLMKRKIDMNNDIKTIDFNASALKLVRNLLHKSQADLAKDIGMTRQTINRLETGEQNISEKFLDKMMNSYPQLAESVELQFDWVSLTFPDLTGKQVIDEVVSLKSDLFLEHSTSQNFYTREFSYAGEKNIYIQDFDPVTNPDTQQIEQKTGTTLYLTGKGTRLFEKALLEQNMTWRDFFIKARRYRGHLTRLDIALNDKWGLLNMNDIVRAVQEKRFWTKSRSYAIHGNSDAGWTVNFGKAPFVIRAYDKQKEQESKGNDTDIKNRVELELHQDRAEQVLDEWFANDNLVDFTVDMLYTYLWFTDEPIADDLLTGVKARDEIEATVKSMASWELLTFLGHKMKFIRQPKTQSVDSIKKWVEQAVAPSLAVLQKTGHWADVLRAIEKAELSDKQQKLVTTTMARVMSQAQGHLKANNLNFDKQREKYIETQGKEIE
ncbi:replication initiation factor domain-containing protein [Leuconostoc citreum]|uniref:replication initiation factor domain-containing protein n=1 Tax=Leuconostoc citreum TaxID=33964 RepID=UPI000246638C|nr:replication initiation factor domain-containing protein [Leuconostoc citreum]CCF27458.1 Predicted transcriptional regulator [Leuconostoc citreum LBAE C11]